MRVDMIGKTFGYLTVIGFSEKTAKRVVKWLCSCRCGNEVVVTGSNLRNGHTKSCSCLQKEIVARAATKHNGSRQRIYHIWQALFQRCRNSNHPGYARYGGRGIFICPEWESFETFREWAYSNGYKDDLTIDRIDNDNGYLPENCRWTDYIIQANNTCRNRRTVVNGELLTIAEIARKYSILYTTVSNRYALGHRSKNLISKLHLNKAGAKADE